MPEIGTITFPSGQTTAPHRHLPPRSRFGQSGIREPVLHGHGVRVVQRRRFVQETNTNPTNPTAAFPIEINNATSGMRVCVNGQAGSIGFLSLYGNLPAQNETDSYFVENIDGTQPNAHNAAAGYYKYATQTFAQSSTTNGALLIKRAATQSTLAGVTGNETVTIGADHRFTAGRDQRGITEHLWIGRFVSSAGRSGWSNRNESGSHCWCQWS